MPTLDRRIVIERNEGEVNRFGEFVDNWTAWRPTWAIRTALGTTEIDTPEGTRTVESVSWLVRYTPALATADIRLLRIRDADGNLWGVEGRTEGAARRRFFAFDTTGLA